MGRGRLAPAPQGRTGRATQDTIENPVTGERIRFLASSADRLTFELAVRPGGHVAAAHRHPLQTETFALQDGSLTFRVGQRLIAAGPGDLVLIPQGVVHDWRHAGDRPALCICTLAPALAWEDLFRRLFAAAALPGANAKTGLPPAATLLTLLGVFPDHAYAPFPPASLQKAAAWACLTLGKDAGRRP